MRTILSLALCAVAANAIDSQAYLNGFSQQFGLDQTVIQDGVNCVAGIQSAVVEVIQIVERNENNIPALLLQAQGLVEELQSKLAFECQPVAEDVTTIVAQALQGQDLERVVERNVQLYFPELVQKVAQWAQYLAQEEDEKAGQTEAYILQVLLGTQQPETLPVPQPTQYVAFDEEKFMNEYIPTFYKALGFEDVNVAALTQCANQLQTLAGSVITLTQELPNLELDGKILAVRDFVDAATEELRSCEGAINLEFEVLAKVVEAADGDYLGYVLQSVENLALNFPEYAQLQEQVVADIQEGEYTLAAEDNAKSVKLIDGGRTFAL